MATAFRVCARRLCLWAVRGLRGLVGPLPVTRGRREACGAWPGFETTRRAKLVARTASGRAGLAPPGSVVVEVSPGSVVAKVEGDVVDVLGECDVWVVGEACFVVEGAGADFLGDVGAGVRSFGEGHEGDVGDGPEGVGAG